MTSSDFGLRRAYLDPYIIAEIGMNYEGSMSRAKAMISQAARAGAHAAKFQMYKADTLASRGQSPSYWDTASEPTTSQHELFSRFDGFGEAEYDELATHCAVAGIDFMATPFDFEAVGFLAERTPAIKVASADLTNRPLLRRVANTGRPVMLSVGASTLLEIDSAVALLADAGCSEIALLHCVLNYPTPPERANLLAIRLLAEHFGDRVVIGYSDHVSPSEDGSMPALEMASLLGARILEKHFTDDRTALGNDHYHAFDEATLERFTQRLVVYRQLAGHGQIDLAHQQAAIDNARRRIFFAVDVPAGTTLDESTLVPLRANTGVEIARWDEVVGATLKVDRLAGDPLNASDVGL